MTRYDTLRQVTSSLKRCYIKLCDTVTRVTRFSAFKKVKNEIKLIIDNTEGWEYSQNLVINSKRSRGYHRTN